MRHRLFRISLLLFVTAWFGVIVPGHRRGQISLPGWQKACCSIPAKHGEPADKQPTQCAVCHLLVILDLPTTVQAEVPPLAFVKPAEVLSQSSIFSSDFLPTCFERGPPMA